MNFRILLLFLFAFSKLLAQSEGTTILHGTVTSTGKSMDLFCYGCLSFEYSVGNNSLRETASVDKEGKYHVKLPKNTDIHIYSYYSDIHKTELDIKTTDKDSIKLDLKVRPKEYVYTRDAAVKDINSGLIQIITYDTLAYNWNKELKYNEKHGFTYYLLSFPEDYEFRNNIDGYNFEMQNHLDSIDPAWYEDVFTIEDSLRHLEADNYIKSHKIDLKNLKFPKNAKLSKKMQLALEEQKSESERIFRHGEKQNIEQGMNYYLNKIDSFEDYYPIFYAEYALPPHYADVIPELITRITNGKEVGLKNTADLIIWERIESGDLEFYGHGGIAADDLFTVAGRANHLLKKITGEDFGYVSMYSTEKDLKKLQGRWIYWLKQIRN